MFGHRSFLVLGDGAADIVSLIKGGQLVISLSQMVDDGMSGNEFDYIAGYGNGEWNRTRQLLEELR